MMLCSTSTIIIEEIFHVSYQFTIFNSSSGCFFGYFSPLNSCP
nr:MAG TPA: hypothetical protein [Crassvirales sp.]